MSCVRRSMFLFIVLAATTTTIVYSTSSPSEPGKEYVDSLEGTPNEYVDSLEGTPTSAPSEPGNEYAYSLEGTPTSSPSEPGNDYVDGLQVLWHIHAVNRMSKNEILIVHCKSRDNDIGKHYLRVGEQIEWKFRENIFGKTLFWCYMTTDRRLANLNVFWEDERLFYRCNWKNCIWIAKEDGIYLRNIPENFDEFHLKWDTYY